MIGQTPPGAIVVGIDDSPRSLLALDFAVEQARLSHRPLSLVHAISPTDAVWLMPSGIGLGAPLGLGLDVIEKYARTSMADRRSELRVSAPDVEAHSVVAWGDPRQVLLAASQHASMLVLGSRGRGPVRSLMLGSVALGVSRHVPCPLVVLRPSDALPRFGVLVGVDGSERGSVPLEFAFAQASMRRMPLTVLHVAREVRHAGRLLDDEPGAKQGWLLLSESLAGLGEKYPDVVVTRHLSGGLADLAILDAGRSAEIIVVGAHHGSSVDELVLGSVAATVLERATCTVAVIPPTPSTEDVT